MLVQIPEDLGSGTKIVHFLAERTLKVVDDLSKCTVHPSQIEFNLEGQASYRHDVHL